LVALLVGTARAPRTDRTRAAAILWGAWTVVTALTFSYMSGIAHPYYAVALAPGIAALVGIGATVLWGWRSHILARAGLAAMVAVTAAWDFELLGRVSWAPGLRWFVLVGGLIAAAALLVPGSLLRRAGLVTVAALAVVTTGAAGAAWGVGTAGPAHTGSTPTSGPAGVSTGGFGGGRGFPGGGGGFPGRGNSQSGAVPGGGEMPDFSGGGNMPSFPGGGTGQNGQTGAPQSFPGGGGGRTGGGPGGGQTANSELVALLKATNSRWAAATNGSMEAAPTQLASGRPVMAIGGFTGSDPSPTLAEFQAYVTAGEVRYYIAGGGMGGGGFGRSGGGSISNWVEQNFTSTTVGGSTVYDLSKPKTTG
jgi:hypothetical protein